MYYSGDFEIKETRSAFIVSEVGKDKRVRITKVDAENVFSDEEPEMIATLLAVIEVARYNEIESKKFLGKNYIPKRIIDDEDFLEKLNFLLECRMTSIDALIYNFSQMKYHEIIEFFDEEFTEETYEELLCDD